MLDELLSPSSDSLIRFLTRWNGAPRSERDELLPVSAIPGWLNSYFADRARWDIDDRRRLYHLVDQLFPPAASATPSHNPARRVGYAVANRVSVFSGSTSGSQARQTR